MTSIGIGIGDTGPVFTPYRVDTKMCSIAHRAVSSQFDALD